MSRWLKSWWQKSWWPKSWWRKSFDLRNIAVATAGFGAFVNLYSPQALLPELAERIPCRRRRDQRADDRQHGGDRDLTAPFTGALADVVGPQTPDHRRHVRRRGPDRDHDACLDACRNWRSGASSRACCCRRSSPSPSPISATNGRRADVARVAGALHVRHQHRRILRPLYSGSFGRRHRLARRLRGGGGC